MGWVTLEDGQHIFITAGGKVIPTGPTRRTQKPALGELSVREVERIASHGKTLEMLPSIRSRKGEQITVSIHSNPLHAVLHRSEGERPYLVRTLVNGTMNDSRAFAKLAQAQKYAVGWHRTLSREERTKKP